MTAALLPIEFEAPLIESTSGGLYAATTWAGESGPSRWLASGIRVRVSNYGGDSASGIWEAPWSADPGELTPDDVKTGTRPGNLDPFTPLTTWVYDQSDDGDLTNPTAAQVLDRAERILAVSEPITVEREFATRLRTDAGTPAEKASLAEALGHLEELFAATGILGVIHARAGLLAIAEANRLTLRDPAAPGVLRTPAGHRWAFGGGYAAPGALGDTLIATSALYGWRDRVLINDTMQHEFNRYMAVAERSVVVAYERAIGAVTLTADGPP